MYDHLVVPIPPKRDSNDERKTIDAEREWKRWKENAWNPARLTQLLAILGDIAVPVEWTAPRRRAWRRAYEREKQAPHVATADHIAKELAFQVTGERLLDVVPAMAKGVVAVAPYTSLAELKKDLGITQRPLTGDHLEAAPRLPGSVLSAVLGGEFFVPDDPDKDDFYP